MEEQFHNKIFNYLDYRKFLKDWYVASKANGKPVSLRWFSKHAGLTSSNYLKLVMDGKRNLSYKSIYKFAQAIKLNKKETEYFKNLVLYNQAHRHEEKDSFYRELIKCNLIGQLKSLQQDQYEYYSTWYHPVIRELIASEKFDGSAEWIANRINPSLTTKEVQDSLTLLKRLGFIKKISKTKWAQANTLVTSGPEPESTIIFNHHRDLLNLARDMITQIPYQQRDISSLTIGLPQEKIKTLKTKIVKFREEIMKMASEYTTPEEVVLVNLQMFPVTKIKNDPNHIL